MSLHFCDVQCLVLLRWMRAWNWRVADDVCPGQSDEEPFQVRLSDESFETYELDPPPYTIEVTKKELKQIYYDMVVVRYATARGMHSNRDTPN